MKLIYIATRLSPDKSLVGGPAVINYFENLKESFKAAAEVWRKGHFPVVPGLDLMLFIELDGDYGRMGWSPYQGSLELMRRCDAVLIHNGLTDLPKSSGVKLEHDEALSLHMEVYYSLDEIPEAEQ